MHKMLSRVGLRHMDFLKYSGKVVETDATARYSPSGLGAGFSEHPCPEIAGVERNIKKISYSYAGHERTFCAICLR